MINEIIVVEGIKDAQAVRQALGHVDIIWTHGFGVTAEQILYIKRAVKERGVLVFTDPDRPGRMIRDLLEKKAPGVGHVYLSRTAAQGPPNKSVGIEHASPQAIREAFARVCAVSTPSAIPQPDLFTWGLQDLTDLGLNGNPQAAVRRRLLGKYLQIGEANAKQFTYRLNSLRVSREEVLESLAGLEIAGDSQ